MRVDSLVMDSLRQAIYTTQAHADSIEARLNRLEATSFQQGPLLENFGTIYTMMTAFLGLVTLLLAAATIFIPGWVNRVSIVPAKQMMADFEKKMNDSVSGFLIESVKSRISNAILDCKSHIAATKQKGVLVLGQLKHEVFSEENIKSIIEIIGNPSHIAIRRKLLDILLQQDSNSIKTFAQLTLVDSNRVSDWPALYRYILVIQNKTDELSFFKILFNTSAHGATHLGLFFRTLLENNTSEALLNLSNLNNSLSQNFKITHTDFSALKDLFNEKGLLQELEGSDFYKSLSNHIPA